MVLKRVVWAFCGGSSGLGIQLLQPLSKFSTLPRHPLSAHHMLDAARAPESFQSSGETEQDTDTPTPLWARLSWSPRQAAEELGLGEVGGGGEEGFLELEP